MWCPATDLGGAGCEELLGEPARAADRPADHRNGGAVVRVVAVDDDQGRDGTNRPKVTALT
jgi:hypothetical protein